MEKISNIVRGNARVATTDVKSSGAVRPGALSFGRPIGESPQAPEAVPSTAMRTGAMFNEMTEARKARSHDRIVTDMADQFFMTRVRRPEEQIAAPAISKVKLSAQDVDTEAMDEITSEGQQEAVEIGQPSGFVPRGSYVNVKA